MNREKELQKLINQQTSNIQEDKKFEINWQKSGIRSRLDYCHRQYIKGIERNLKKSKRS